MENELEKIIKNLEKLLNKDFDFINAGRIVVASESREVNINIIDEICNQLNIQTNHINKDELKKIIKEIDLKLDYLEPEIPKVKRRWLTKNSCIRTYKIADEKIYLQNLKLLSKKKGGFKTIMEKYGYARVSTEVQDLERQLKALKKAGVKPNKIFKDIGSGKDFERIEYQKLVNKVLKKGDILYITSIDRLGRDMKLIEEEYKLITETRECQLISLEEPFLSTSQDEITNDLLRPILLKFLGWVAERERKELLKRQKQAYNSMSKNSRGKLISNRTGKVIGRPKKWKELTKEQRDKVEEWIRGERSCLSVSKELGISRSTLQRIKEEEYQ